MSDDKIDAIDRISDVVKMAIKGWPIYAVIVSGGWFFGQMWLDKYISDAIKQKTLEVPAVVTMTGAVQANTNAIGELKGDLRTIKGDTTAILLHLAGEGE